MQSTVTRARRAAGLSLSLVLGAAAASAALAQAQGAPAAAPKPPADDSSLTWHGITLYGIVDIGLQYETHGAPFSDYHPAGSANIVQKNSRQSVFGATPSNLSQSRIGLAGLEPLGDRDLAVVFRLETFFNPQSGNISDAQKSMTLNNGKSAATSGTNLNSSVAGQAFQTSYIGLSSRQWGTLTFGRQTTLLADGIGKYDPNYASQAFSLVGMSGGYAGGGDTEDRRLDGSIKYYATFADMFHAGVLYKPNGSNGSANTAYQAVLGGEIAGLSVDAYYAKTNSAISSAPLNADQVNGLGALGYSITNSLVGTVSDNTAYAIMALYKLDQWKFFASYEHIKFANPSNPLPAGFVDIGGYVLAYVNNNAYVNDKIQNVYWAGVRWTAIPHLDLTAAYYGYHQNSYASGANAGCSSNVNGACSGSFESFAFDADYAFTKRFDVYAGAMYSGVKDGVANGYVFNTTNINPTVGFRFKF